MLAHENSVKQSDVLGSSHLTHRGRRESSHPSRIKTSVDTMITAGAGNHQHEVLYTSLPANGWGAP